MRGARAGPNDVPQGAPATEGRLRPAECHVPFRSGTIKD